ncbi:spore germination protein GerPB [Bacillus sp. JJ722]|uniref:spore germination protein GerPB n=1 Tax=Bacillus sp. JJ722 TaxID=3122973 RepID=UPI002FFF1F3D
MQFNVTQSIHIHSIKISSISNSSIFQIGSAGIIKSLSTLNNSGQFTEEAPQIPSQTIVQRN